MILGTDHLLVQANGFQPGQELCPPLPVDIIGGAGWFVFWFNRIGLIHRLFPYQDKICKHDRIMNIMWSDHAQRKYIQVQHKNKTINIYSSVFGRKWSLEISRLVKIIIKLIIKLVIRCMTVSEHNMKHTQCTESVYLVIKYSNRIAIHTHMHSYIKTSNSDLPMHVTPSVNTFLYIWADCEGSICYRLLIRYTTEWTKEKQLILPLV